MVPPNDHTSYVLDHGSQITTANLKQYRGLKYCDNYVNVTQRQEGSKGCWKNGADRLGRCRVATNLPFVKNTICEVQ